MRLELAFQGNDDDSVGSVGLDKHSTMWTVNTDWTSVKPYMRHATLTKVVPFLGRSLYESLLLTGDAGPHYDLLLDVVAAYTAARAYPLMGSSMSDGGTNTGSGGEGAMPTPLWQHKVTHLNLVKTADELMDRLGMAIEVDPALDFDDDVESRARILTHAAAFQRYHNISQSLMTYRALVPAIEEAIVLHIAPIVGTMLDNLSATDAVTVGLKVRIERLTAKQALVIALPALTILIDGGGLRTLSSSDALVGVAAAGYREASMTLATQLQMSVDKLRADLMTYIRSNIDNLPILKATGQFDAPRAALTVYGEEDGGAVGFFG